MKPVSPDARDLLGPLPIYHKIFIVLREKILQGEFSRDMPIPGEMALSRMYNVSRVTIRRALQKLEEEGLISREPGRGTYVRDTRPADAVSANIGDLIKNLVAMGFRTKVEVLDISDIDCPSDVAGYMDFSTSSRIRRVDRIHRYNDQIFAYTRAFVTLDYAKYCTRDALSRSPLLHVLQQNGLQISGAQQWLSAQSADVAVAEVMNVEVGSPLLSIKRAMKDQKGSVAEFLYALYRPDQYEFIIELSMDGNADSMHWKSVHEAI